MAQIPYMTSLLVALIVLIVDLMFKLLNELIAVEKTVALSVELFGLIVLFILTVAYLGRSKEQ